MTIPDSLLSLVKTDIRKLQLTKTLFASAWCEDLFSQNANLLEQILGSTELHLDEKWQRSQIEVFLNSKLILNSSCEDFDASLRACRRQFIAAIIWRDVNRLVDMEDTCETLSWFAELCLQACLNYHFRSLCQSLGTPKSLEGKTQGLLILGMGKLGAWELNLSSDIDLIFCYPEKGNTDDPEKALSNQEFFSRLGKKIIQSLDKITAEGFVFRVDMRLRPYGNSGALVSSFAALEDYYQTQGREWERYAMVKARIVASNAEQSTHPQLNELLRSFTYRKYIDFSVIDSLRKLKELINQEVQRRNLGDNIKLGFGGIREVEFIAQVFQLIRGGRDHQLQDGRLKVVLPLLERMGCLPEIATDLWQAYHFLRNTEHALQAWKDEQTQELPKDEAGKTRLAAVMGFKDWESFFSQLEAHRRLVHAEFEALIAPTEDKLEHNKQIESTWVALWSDALSEQEALTLLAEHQHEDPQQSLALLESLRVSSNVVNLAASSRERLDEFVPLLLQQLALTTAPTETLKRILKLVHAVVRRSAYLVLLVENPPALEQLIKLCVASPWIADQLALHPALLDELLDPRTLYHPPDLDELRDELQQHMLRIPEDDLEQQMEALRYYRSSHALRVAACEITAALPLMKVSDYLSWLAEVILQYVLQLAWRDMTLNHGYPDGATSPDFIIVGYGKLGGIELGHGSDLDLVFIYDAEINGQTSGNAEGKRQLENSVFYMRLGQKIIHILNSNTVGGQLYEVDMRLRPSGNSGLLVSSIRAFERYQKETAWTWEHQALVRARVVAGNSRLAKSFASLRKEILCQHRQQKTLRKEVIDMRNKMREHLGSERNRRNSKLFDLKQDAGGIVDIEFMVQYAVLAWAAEKPELTRYTDNIRILESLERSSLLGTQEVAELSEAYKAFRSIGHSLTLQQQTNLIDGKLLAKERQAVSKIWRTLMLSDQEN